MEFSLLYALEKQERKETVRIFMYAHELPFRIEKSDPGYGYNWTELRAASHEYLRMFKPGNERHSPLGY